MRRNGRFVFQVSNETLLAQKKRLKKKVKIGIGSSCKLGCHSACTKKKCQCYCHYTEYKEMINP